MPQREQSQSPGLFLNTTAGHWVLKMAKKLQACSREFDSLIRAIGECKSKAEEDAIIMREVDVLKPRLKDPRVDSRQMKELMVRLIYVEMLGHDASWGHVNALRACSEKPMLTKKVRRHALWTALHMSMHLLYMSCA